MSTTLPNLRVMMLGTGPFAVPTLRAIAASKHELLGVVSRPPKGRKPQPSPMMLAAEELGHTAWTPETVNEEGAIAKLRAAQAHLLVVCDYGEILRDEVLATALLGGVNLHGSLLPKFRGAAPVAWAIWRGEQETGNTIIQMTPGLDAGPILAQESLPIHEHDTAETLECRLAERGAPLVISTLNALHEGSAELRPQDIHAVSKAPRLRKSHGRIDWQQPAESIERQIRALQPWPKCFTFWQREPSQPALRLTLLASRVVPESELPPSAATAEPGTVVSAADSLSVRCGQGLLLVKQVQPAGKKAMETAAFLRGYPIEVGTCLLEEG